MIELRQLRYFLVVADELHFGRAAARLHIAQPAVSQQVRRLESELGTRLVERTTRRVALTEAGVRFLPHAQAVLDTLERGRRAVLDASPDGPLRLGTCEGLGERLARLLRVLGRSRPSTRVELARLPEPERLDALASGDLDAVFVHSAPRSAGLRCTPAWHDDLLVVLPAAHRLAGAGPVRLADLAAMPLCLVGRGRNPALHAAVDVAASRAGVALRLAPQVDDDLIATVATRRDAWSLYYPGQARLTDAQAAGVAFVPVTGPAVTMTTSLVTARTSDDLCALREACGSVE